ncbi:MAG: hypothetical protein ACRDIB_06320, partial [Ardenticatenaceae bacterium]
MLSSVRASTAERLTLNVQRSTLNVGAALLLLLAFLLQGCLFDRPLLYDVRLEPHTTISPNADEIDDLTRLHYAIGESARVTIAFKNEAGERFLWRDGVRRTA